MGLFMPRVNGFGGFDLAPWSDKPHLLLFGGLGMMVCMIVGMAVSGCVRKKMNGCTNGNFGVDNNMNNQTKE